MIAIDSVLVSDQVIEEQFVCDLTKCKGGCCEDGDAGAPLENKEKDYIKKYYDIVEPYMTKEGIKEVIFISSTSVYGNLHGIITEKIPFSDSNKSAASAISSKGIAS